MEEWYDDSFTVNGLLEFLGNLPPGTQMKSSFHALWKTFAPDMVKVYLQPKPTTAEDFARRLSWIIGKDIEGCMADVGIKAPFAPCSGDLHVYAYYDNFGTAPMNLAKVRSLIVTPGNGACSMKVKVRLRLGHMELFGSNTLSGSVMNQNPDVSMSEIKKLTVEVEMTSTKWKENNNGPHLTIVPEYASAELIRNILYFTNRGIQVEVVDIISDPS